MRRFAGCCRFVWNKALALEKETYENEGKRLGFSLLCKFLRDWKKENATSFLSEAHSQILQQVLKDLDRAYKNFFEKRAGFPRFKKKGLHDAFRYPQGFKLAWLGGTLLLVPPQYTSQTCSHCGCVDKSNRVSQAKFKCTACGFECNADHNAALNILAAGQAVSACGAGRAQAPASKQEPAYGAAR